MDVSERLDSLQRDEIQMKQALELTLVKAIKEWRDCRKRGSRAKN